MATAVQGIDEHSDEDSNGSAAMDIASDASSSPSPQQPPAPGSTVGAKRKASNDPVADGESFEDQKKKPKLAPPVGSQPPLEESPPAYLKCTPECWQEIFSYLPPVMLARCLRLSRRFNGYLTRLTPSPPLPKRADSRVVRVRDSDSVWAEARKAYFPQLPKPLKQCNERTMIRLIGGRHCETCNKEPTGLPAQTPITQYTAGPGVNGVRVVFAFGVRVCGPCLGRLTDSDISLFQSQYRNLLPGLPFAFLTPELHLVTSTVRKQQEIPAKIRAGKVFFSTDVKNLYLEYQEAQELGAGAVEEWQKGLKGLGDTLMADAGRWEKWEATLPLGVDLANVIREYDPTPSQAIVVPGRSAAVDTVDSVDAVDDTQLDTETFTEAPIPSKAPPDAQNGLTTTPNPQAAASGKAQQSQYPPRQARTAEEAEKARQSRKAELEQRCMQLQPPIMPRVLHHMAAYHNAMQSVQPVNDAQWEVLKPRIEAQRDAAELFEHQRNMQYAALEAAARSQYEHARISKPAREEYGHKYEQAQEPLRRKLCEYADDVINGQWGAGRTLSRESCPIFAVDVLQHVKQKYDLDFEVLRARGERPFRHSKAKHNDPDPFLSLENMKFVHDKKIRPLTESYAYDLFVCAGCQPVNSSTPPSKWYALESLIQHYGAKHADGEFSRDNIVVHWQTAAWPGDPPFDPDPGRFLKAERPAPDRRGNARSRSNQQHLGFRGARYESAATNAQTPGLMLSETPFFRAEASADAGGSNIAASLDALSHLAADIQTRQNRRTDDDRARTAQDEVISSEACRVWDTLNVIPDALVAVRVQAAMHQAAKQFQANFGRVLAFDRFTDASVSSEDMEPLRAMRGLVCQCCLDDDNGKRDEPYFMRIKDAKLFSFERLCVHFDIMHISAQNGDALKTNWLNRLLEQPDDQQIYDLISAEGMDDGKLGLIAEAFPSVFPYPLPPLAQLLSASRTQSNVPAYADKLMKRLNKSNNQQKAKKKSGNQRRRDGREASESLPSAAEDEYDPRRPVLAGKEPEYDPSKFDTDVSKPPMSSAPKDASALPYQLNSETMKALSDFLGPQAQPPAPAPAPAQSWRATPQNGHHNASAPTPANHFQSPAGVNTEQNAPPPANGVSSSASTAQPLDISAILRSLQGPGGQSHTPGQAIPSAASLPPLEAPSAPSRYEQPPTSHGYALHDYNRVQQPSQAYARESPSVPAYDQQRSSSRYEARPLSVYQPSYPTSTRYEPPTQPRPSYPGYASYNPEQPQQPAYPEQARHYATGTPSYQQQAYHPPPQQYGHDLSAAIGCNNTAYEQNAASSSYAPHQAPPPGFREAAPTYQPPQYAKTHAPQGYRPASPAYQHPPPQQGYRPASPAYQQPPPQGYRPTSRGYQQYGYPSFPVQAQTQYPPPQREYAAPPPQYYDEYGRLVQMVRVDEGQQQQQQQQRGYGEGEYYQ